MDAESNSIQKVKSSIFEKLFGFGNKKNASIELRNLFNLVPLKNIKIFNLIEIEKKYKVNIYRNFNSDLLQIYREYLSKFLSDKNLIESEKEDLHYLKSLLRLTDSEIKDIHLDLTSIIYKNSFETALSDNNLTEDKISYLTSIRESLELPAEIADSICAEVRSKNVKKFWDQISSDEKLSPEELKKFDLLSQNLKVELKFSDATIQDIKRMKLLWSIENGFIPEIDLEIKLQAGEIGYYRSNINWHELRTKTTRINFHGPTARIKLFEGVYYRLGSISPQRITKDELQLIDSGTIYLTNKRIIFVGIKKNRTIPINKILYIEPYDQGVVINKKSGISPVIELVDDDRLFTLILDKIVNS